MKDYMDRSHDQTTKRFLSVFSFGLLYLYVFSLIRGVIGRRQPLKSDTSSRQLHLNCVDCGSGSETPGHIAAAIVIGGPGSKTTTIDAYVDKGGNVTTLFKGQGDTSIIHTSGNRIIWSKRLAGSLHGSHLYSIGQFGDGYLLAAGYTGHERKAIGHNGLIFKMSAADGSVIWSTRISRAEPTYCGTVQQAVWSEMQSKVFFAGKSCLRKERRDCESLIGALDASGQKLWSYVSSEAGYYESAYSVAADDANGAALWAGYRCIDDSVARPQANIRLTRYIPVIDCYIKVDKLSGVGELLWSRMYKQGAEEGKAIYAEKILISEHAAFLLANTWNINTYRGSSSILLQLSLDVASDLESGLYQAKIIHGKGQDRGHGLALDKAGAIYVTGESTSFYGADIASMYVLKLKNDLSKDWVLQLAHPHDSNFHDRVGNALTALPDGGVLASGWTSSPAAFSPFQADTTAFTIAILADGSVNITENAASQVGASIDDGVLSIASFPMNGIEVGPDKSHYKAISSSEFDRFSLPFEVQPPPIRICRYDQLGISFYNQFPLIRGQAAPLSLADVHIYGWEPSAINTYDIYIGDHHDVTVLRLSRKVRSFTADDITKSYIQIEHSGFPSPPFLELSAENGCVYASAYRAVPFHYTEGSNTAPQIVLGDPILPKKGAVVSVGLSNLGATDAETLNAHSLVFTITTITGGSFTLRNIPSNMFTLEELAAGEVKFSHDGLTSQPSANISVMDEAGFRTEPATMIFGPLQTENNTPLLIRAPAEAHGLTQHQQFCLDSSHLLISDEEPPAGSLKFVLNELKRVQVFNEESPLEINEEVTQADVTAGRISLLVTHDHPPLAQFRGSDGEFETPPALNFNAYKTAVPDLPQQVHFTIPLEALGDTVELTREDILYSNPDIKPSDIIYFFSELIHCRFEISSSEWKSTSLFSQADINAGNVRFISLGGGNPSFSYSVTDGTHPETTIAKKDVSVEPNPSKEKYLTLDKPIYGR